MRDLLECKELGSDKAEPAPRAWKTVAIWDLQKGRWRDKGKGELYMEMGGAEKMRNGDEFELEDLIMVAVL